MAAEINDRLIPGKVNPEHLDLLLSLTRICAEPVIAGLHLYFVEGTLQKDVIKTLGITQSQFSRKVSDVRQLDERIARLAVYYK